MRAAVQVMVVVGVVQCSWVCYYWFCDVFCMGAAVDVELSSGRGSWWRQAYGGSGYSIGHSKAILLEVRNPH